MRIIDVDLAAGEQRNAVITLKRRGGELTFVFLPMEHVAVPEFYASVGKRLEACDMIIHEGIAVTRLRDLALFAVVMPYKLRRLRPGGCVQQNTRKLLPRAVPAQRVDATAAQVRADMRTEFGWWLYLLLPAFCVLGLALALRSPNSRLRHARPIDVALPMYVPRGPIRRPSHLPDILHRALTDRRNQMLFKALDRVDLKHRNEPLTIGVMYGAEHIADAYLHAFIRLGYRPVGQDWLTALRASPQAA